MAEATVRDWISEYKVLDSGEVHSFASTISHNNELIQAIFTVLEEKRHHQEFLEPVCEQLFSFYRSKEESLQRFTQQYIPCLIGIYLSHIAKGSRKHVRNAEVLLLGIYNLEVTDSSGKPRSFIFRIPTISKPSIYHEPMSLSHSMLTERALSTLEYTDCQRYSIGPDTEIEKINASNRLDVMSVLMRLYNLNIGFMSTNSHISLCKMCTRVVKQGYNRSNRSSYNNDCTTYGNPHPRPVARIRLSTKILLEMVHSIYFAMFNGVASAGLQSLEELHYRAVHEMLPEVLLVTNAIRNSLKVNPSGQPSDGPMGISISLSPTTVVNSVSRAITNASFRTKKLPDDIPIQTNGEAGENHQLSAINEEENPEQSAQINVTRAKKQVANGSNPITSSITKAAVLQLRKDKAKDKKKDKEFSHSESNGSSKSLPPSVSNSFHSDLATSDAGNEETSFNNLRHAYSYKIEQFQNSSLVSNTSTEGHHALTDDRFLDGKCVNDSSNTDTNAILTHDVKFILHAGIHKSESTNGIPSSSMQTAV